MRKLHPRNGGVKERADLTHVRAGNAYLEISTISDASVKSVLRMAP